MDASIRYDTQSIFGTRVKRAACTLRLDPKTLAIETKAPWNASSKKRRLFPYGLTIPLNYLYGCECREANVLSVHGVTLQTSKSTHDTSARDFFFDLEFSSPEQQDAFKALLTEAINPQGAGRPRRLLAIVNPAGGNNKAAHLYNYTLKPMLSRAGISLSFQLSKYPRHASLIAHDASFQNYDGIVVIGGDGCVHEVINGIMQRKDWRAVIEKFSFAVVAGGSSNGFCKSINMYDAVYAAYCIIKGRIEMLDIMAYEHLGRRIYGFLAFHWGFFADVGAFSESYRRVGRLKYTFAVAEKLFKMQEREAKVWVLDDSALPSSPSLRDDAASSNSAATSTHTQEAGRQLPSSKWRYKHHFATLPNLHVRRIINCQFASFSAVKRSWIDRNFLIGAECDRQDGRMHLYTICRESGTQSRRDSVLSEDVAVFQGAKTPLEPVPELESLQQSKSFSARAAGNGGTAEQGSGPSSRRSSLSLSVAGSMLGPPGDLFRQPMARHLTTRAFLLQMPLTPDTHTCNAPSPSNRIRSPKHHACCLFDVDGEMLQRADVYVECWPRFLRFIVPQNHREDYWADFYPPPPS